MISETQTVTALPVTAQREEQASSQEEKTPIVLRLRERPTLQLLSNRLLDILEEHKMAGDHLSRRVQNWGVEVLQLMLDDSPNIQVLLARKINELQRKILVNPMGRAPLQISVWEAGRRWEQWMLVHYQQLSRFSPYDGRLIDLENVKMDTFANQMIAWLRDVFDVTADPALSRLSQEIELIECERESQIQVLQEQIDCEQDPKEREILIRQKLALGCSKAFYVTEEEAKAADRDEVLEDYQAMAQDILEIEEYSEVRVHQRELKSRLLQEIRLTEEADQRNRAAMRELLAESERSTKQNLDAVIESSDRQIQAKDEVIARLRSEIQRLEICVRQLDGESHSLHAKVDAHGRTIAALKAEINRLRREIESMDDDSCVIM